MRRDLLVPCQTARSAAGRVAAGRAAVVLAVAGLAVGAALPEVPAHAAETAAPTAASLRLRMGAKREIYVYAPAADAHRAAHAILFFSSDWGWRQNQQDLAAHLAGEGRCVVGIDSTEYFDRRLENADWAKDLKTLRVFANQKAGLPEETPVVLIGFTWGAELLPYMLNRGGTEGFAGAVLIGPKDTSGFIYRVALQMKGVPLPPGETFDVAEELRRLAPLPVVLMEGALDPDSRAKALSDLPHGPHVFMSIPGADRHFRDGREILQDFLSQALAWVENPRATLQGRSPAPVAPAPAAPAPTAPPPAGQAPAKPPAAPPAVSVSPPAASRPPAGG